VLLLLAGTQRRYASLDRKRKVRQAVRALHARTQKADKELEEKVEAGKKVKKRKRRQGDKVEANIILDPAAGHLLDNHFKGAIDSFFASCNSSSQGEDGTAADVEERDESNVVLPEIELDQCDDCSNMLDTDVKVPKILMALHKILVHSEAYDKAGKKSKAS